ncbi:MAG: DNA-packaging protein [Lentisphaerae bacterium]|nr:DNA-packaging protein [Lentisphaerota bacterium]
MPTDFSYTPAQLDALTLISGECRNVMLFGGSRSGKTFLLCCVLVIRALRAPGSRHAIIRRYANAVRSSIGADTLPKVLKYRFNDDIRYEYRKTEGVFAFENGSEIWLIGLDDNAKADKILGKEFVTLYFNECSELDYSSVQIALTRLAQHIPPLTAKAFFDCNPPGKKHWTYRVFIEKNDPVDHLMLKNPDNYAAIRINPLDNAVNLPPGYIENTLAGLPRRQRERFLEGKFLDEVEGALWKRDMIDSARIINPPEFQRIVIGVDPAVTSGSSSDNTGIVAAAAGIDGEYYVIADDSMHGTPLEWAKQVISLYHRLGADRVTGEVNNGGDLIEALLRKFDPDVSFHPVRASRGKTVRAEPIAALYEKGKVHHVGEFPLLEEEMISFAPGSSIHSPDRMDALVWAITELSENSQRFILA